MQYSIVMKKQLNDEFRLDAEYFQPIYLHQDKYVNLMTLKQLGQIAYITDGQHGYHEVDDSSNILHLTAKNAKTWFANKNNAVRIAKWVDDKNKRSSLCEGDIILSTRGSVGYCAMITKDVLPANIDQDVARIAITDRTYINSSLLVAFINSSYGQHWIKRNLSGMVQQGLPLSKVRRILIPKFGEKYKNIIQSITNIALLSNEMEKKLLKRANLILLEDLNIDTTKKFSDTSYIRYFSDAMSSKRIDAEFYHPRYKYISDNIRNYYNGYKPLKEILHIKNENYVPTNREYQYIELSDIGVNGEITGCTINIGSDLPTRARRKVQNGDIIISSIEGSLNSIAYVDNLYHNAICSTGFYIVSSDFINSETILVLFKSIVGQLQLKQRCSGTILSAINKDMFENILIPKIDMEIQNMIKELVQTAFSERKKTNSILEIAKQSVELSIEQGEQTAIKWINSELKRIGVEYDA
jgi:Restriction endonuclease S subunits